MELKLSVVIPMYNEAGLAGRSASELLDYLDRTFADSYELIFVSDGSTDSCAEEITELAKARPTLRLEGYPVNRGKGCAVRTGILAARGEAIIFTDCDLAYGVEVIGDMYRLMMGAQPSEPLPERPSFDLAIGSRALHPEGYAGYTGVRKLASQVYKTIVRLAAGFRYSDSQTGIKGFTKGAAQRIFKHCEIDGFAFDLEALLIADRMKLSVGELPVKIINHRASKVRLLRDTYRMLRDLRLIKKRVNMLRLD